MTLLVGGLLWTGGELLFSPRPGQPLAVIFPLPTNPEDSLAPWRAGATQVLSFGFWPGLVLVRSDCPDAVDRLYAAGALLVMRAPGRSDVQR